MQNLLKVGGVLAEHAESLKKGVLAEHAESLKKGGVGAECLHLAGSTTALAACAAFTTASTDLWSGGSSGSSRANSWSGRASGGRNWFAHECINGRTQIVQWASTVFASVTLRRFAHGLAHELELSLIHI